MATKPPPRFKRYTSSDIHWRLQAVGSSRQALDAMVDDDGWVAAQALFCPYYNPVEGTLGSDWGVILNPESVKFGQLVFEHEWCGCPTDDEGYSLHGGGKQQADEWCVPSCRSGHSFHEQTYGSCIREKGHRGRHRDHRGREWRP